jgi:hypothetical protein
MKATIQKKGVYDFFNNPLQAKRAYKRCRTAKCFILDDEWIAKHNPTCSGCGKPFSEHDEPEGYRSNRSWYHPGTKKIAVYQYVCAWTTVLNDIHKLADKML